MTDTPFFEIAGPDQPDWILICDHATNRVPPCVNGGDLGIAPADMARHIAWDPGAAGVTRGLARHLQAPAILANFSRLVIDPNRGECDPTLLMKLYDGTIIPANRHVDADERLRRIEMFHRPYHAAVARLLAAHPKVPLVSIHSFTPQLQGRAPRPWHIGILYSDDTRLAAPLMQVLRDRTDWCIGDNKPYSGHLPQDTMDRHGIQTGRPHVLIELRNDLIETPGQQADWAAKLAPLLQQAREKMEQ